MSDAATTAAATTASAGTHPRHALDDVIHSPVRLSLVAALSSVGEADFKALRDQLEVSDSVLSKAAAALEEAGYVAVRKGRHGRRPSTWMSLTAPGRAALEAHLAALRSLLGSGLG